MKTKAGGKQIFAALLSMVMIVTGLSIPTAASQEGAGGNYLATASNAGREYDEEIEDESEGESPVLTVPAGNAETGQESMVRPMILDMTAPVVHSARLLTTEVDYPGHLTLELDITEEERGVSAIYIMEAGTHNVLASASLPEHLFTGIHTVEMDLEPGVIMGRQYTIGGLLLSDGDFLLTSMFDYSPDWPFAEEAIFEVISEKAATYALDKITLQNPVLPSSDYLKADLVLGNVGNGIDAVFFSLKNKDSGNRRRLPLSYYGSKERTLVAGSNTIAVNVDRLSSGSYEVVGIELYGAEGLVSYDKENMPETWSFGDVEFTITEAAGSPPEINRLSIKNTYVHVPGTLDVEMDIKAENGGVAAVTIYLEYPGGDMFGSSIVLPTVPGKYGEIHKPEQSAVQTGTYDFRFPISLDMFPDGDYQIGLVEIVDRAGEEVLYFREDTEWITALPDIHITRANYTLETSVQNPKLPELLRALPDGCEILLDGEGAEAIPKSVFTAVAGRNITVNVQEYGKRATLQALYTFNGKDINTAAIRDVPITFEFRYAAGADYGIADKTVYLLEFEGSGVLPCPITFRLPTAALLAGTDSFNRDAMCLSRLNGKSLTKEGMVNEGAEGFTDIQLTSYSNFIMSLTEPVYKRSSGGSGGSGGSSTKTTISDGTWKQDEAGWWYQLKDGTYPKSMWKKINSQWYYFEDSGYIATGWKFLNGKWYWLDPETGKMLADNWVSDRGNWYYLGADGAMVTGWQNYQGQYYFLSEINDGTYGRMLRGEQTSDGYTVNQDGVWVP